MALGDSVRVCVCVCVCVCVLRVGRVGKKINFGVAIGTKGDLVYTYN